MIQFLQITCKKKEEIEMVPIDGKKKDQPMCRYHQEKTFLKKKILRQLEIEH